MVLGLGDNRGTRSEQKETAIRMLKHAMNSCFTGQRGRNIQDDRLISTIRNIDFGRLNSKAEG